MSHFLWIEDFDNSPKTTANDVLGGIFDYSYFAEEKRQLRKDLEKHGIFIELSFQDGLSFIRQQLHKVDYVIIDINLPAISEGDTINNEVLKLLTDFQGYQKQVDEEEDEKLLAEKRKELREIAGFYLYAKLVFELGFPKDHILFCSQHGEEMGSIKDAFAAAKIALPRIYLKSHCRVKAWVRRKNNNHYSQLRRGIIEACQYLKSLPEEKLQFKEFIKKDADKKIELEDIRNYLGVLENFLPLHKPSDKTTRYKLFVRTLAHEWDVAEPQLINKADKKSGQYAFAWTMKMTRNWMAHGKVFEQLTAQEIAYLFIVNMRAMFDLGNDLLSYEKHLLSLFEPITADEMKDKIGNSPKKDETNLRKIPLAKKYALLLNRYKNFEAINFHDALNGLQKRSHDEKDNDFLIKGLFQTFWFLTSNGYVYIPSDKDRNIAIDKVYDDLKYQFKYFDYHKDSQDYLFELARHIYNRSFSVEK